MSLANLNCYIDGRVVYGRISAISAFGDGLRRVEGAHRASALYLCGPNAILFIAITRCWARATSVPFRHILLDSVLEFGEAAGDKQNR